MNLVASSDDFVRPRKPILIILHQEHSSAGRVGRLLQDRGHDLDIRKPRFGDTLPSTMEDYAGAVIFGGPMSANDTDDFVKQETDWISVPLEEGRPFLGICLGAQMLARNLGAPVYEHPQEEVEIGYYPLEATAAGRAFIDWPSVVYQWHREGFDLPTGAVHLARSETFEYQAFRYGPAAFGVQFHSELTLAMLYRWTVHGAPRLSLKGAQDRQAHFEGRAVHDRCHLDWLDRFLDAWLATDTGVGRETLTQAVSGA
ncbi:MAG: glutamine amidotransferase [Pseudomonadota bacterium]